MAMTAQELREYKTSKQREYREKHRDEINQRQREARQKQKDLDVVTPQPSTADAEKRKKRSEYQKAYRERHSEELRQKRKEAAQRKREAERAELAIAEPFPADTVIAAAVNQAHGFTIVEAEGHSGNRHVLVENISLDGVPVHRVKTVQYSYHRSFDAALIAAKSSKIKFQLFGTGDADA